MQKKKKKKKKKREEETRGIFREETGDVRFVFFLIFIRAVS